MNSAPGEETTAQGGGDPLGTHPLAEGTQDPGASATAVSNSA